MAPTMESPDDIDMSLFLDDPGNIAEPPARLAARFYNKSNARRKSSANSSRRSSLSSIHSHHSALSCHGGPRSTHIAQHLRRASIIESRKARLADRAAHAEQVRLRAAAAKAMPRASYSEEKALAAQAAREKLLAEIAARCEEEVRRAKKIAEETREKRAAEHARLREEMEEKFADAAKRRSLYQSSSKKSRTTSLAAVEEKKINPIVLTRYTESAAAKVIQRTWRTYRTRAIVSDFYKLGLHVPKLSEMTFEDVKTLISDEETIRISARLLKQLDLLDGGSAENGEHTPARQFLSAYMILAHPVQTFSHAGEGPDEQELISKAKSLISTLDTYMKECPNGKSKQALDLAKRDHLGFSYNDFNSAFEAWKSQDLGVLIDVMVNSFVNLDLILQSTKNDQAGRVAEDYFHAVRQEQIKLLARLKRLAGPDEALSRVRTAVRKARKQRELKERKKAPNTVPRASTTENNNAEMSSTTPLTPPATPQPERFRSDIEASSLVNKLGQTMTVLPSNREIAHEMQINGTYEVQQQPWTDMRKEFMDSLRDGMRESMLRGGTLTAATWTHSMAVLIREKLLNLMTPRHPLYDRIDNLLDPKLIEQQCRNGMFEYNSFFATIAELIAQVCSPGRDDIVRAFASDKESDTIDRLFQLINIIDLMTLDHINFQFRMAAQSVIEHGHEHEFASFERDLRVGAHGLNNTKQWWKSARSNLASSTPSGTAIYARGLVDLVFSNSVFNPTSLPETLRLDYVRLLDLRARAFQIVAMSSILLTTKIRLRRNREALWTKDAERLMALDLLNTESTRIVSLIESSHMMPDSTKEGLVNFVGRVLPPAVAAARNAEVAEEDRQAAVQQQETFNPAANTSGVNIIDDTFGEQVATFVLKSLREHVFARLSASSTAEKVRVTTNAAEILARAGMPESVSEVGSMVEILERVRNIDLRAHGKWYDQIAQEVQAEHST